MAIARPTVASPPRLATGLAPLALPGRWLLVACGAVGAAFVLALAVGPVSIPMGGIVAELADQLPFVSVDSGLTAMQAALITEIRLPRAVLALLVGALLATAGGSYQGVFRNPLADPYLLGVAAGAGLGATTAIVAGSDVVTDPGAAVPVAAFAGALLAVGLAYALGVTTDRLRSGGSLILAGVAVAALFTAVQTFLLQRDDEAIRDVYSWLLGRLHVAGWDDIRMVLPYAVASIGLLLACGRRLDVLSVGDEEARALGTDPGRLRLVIVVAASLGTAAAVAATGLIGFVGIIVPHAIRMRTGAGYRRILPLAALYGAAFLCLADLVARTALAPAEIPLGVITAAIGAPFFLVVLRTSHLGER